MRSRALSLQTEPLFAPVSLEGSTIRIVTEALRSRPRGSQRPLGVCSPLTLKMVNCLSLRLHNLPKRPKASYRIPRHRNVILATSLLYRLSLIPNVFRLPAPTGLSILVGSGTSA